MMTYMFSPLKPMANTVSILEKKFTGANPKLEIEGYHLRIDSCSGPDFIRSYANMTLTSDGASSVVTFYGLPGLDRNTARVPTCAHDK